MRVKRALVALSVLGVAGLAAAQPGPPPDPARMPRGPLFISPMGEPFRGAPDLGPPVLVWFAATDADSDGRLTRDEFVAQAREFFTNTLDANRDRTATSTESTALWREQAPEMLTPQGPGPLPPRARPRGGPPGGGGGGGPPGGGGGGGPPGGGGGRGPPGGGGGGGPPGGGPPGGGPPGGMPPGGMPRMPPAGGAMFGLLNDAEPVMACDVDLSGRVTAEEFEACAVRRFDALDADNDGFFVLEESPRSRMLMRPPPRPRNGRP